MSNRSSPDMELMLERALSPGATNSSTAEWLVSSSSSSKSYSSDMTYESSCVSPTKAKETVQHTTSAPETKAMPLVGCPRCLMYVMLSEEDPKCPMCKSTSFLDFLAEEKSQTDN